MADYDSQLPNISADDIGEQARVAAMAGRDQAASPLTGDERAIGAPAQPINSGVISSMTSPPQVPAGMPDYHPPFEGVGDFITRAARAFATAPGVAGGYEGGIPSSVPLPDTYNPPVTATSPRKGPVGAASGGGQQTSATPQFAAGANQGGSADSQAARAGLNRDGSLVGAAQPGVAPGSNYAAPLVGNAQPSDVTDRANIVSKAQLDAMNARDAMNAQTAQAANAAGNQQIIAQDRLNKADEAQRLARFSPSVYGGSRSDRANIADAVGRAEGGVASATSAAQAARNRNYVSEAAAGNQMEEAGRQGARNVVSGRQSEALGSQQLRTGEINQQIQSHMADLQKRASATGPDGDAAREALALYQKAQQGKGGPLTDEDKLKVYGDMISRAVAMGGPDSYKTLPNFNEFAQSLNAKPGAGSAPPPDWMAKARAANPGATDTELASRYKAKQ